jgi:hypothetical protein
MPVVAGVRTAWQRYVYDNVAFAVATALPNPISFFTIPLGGGTSPSVGSGAKQVQDTNLVEARKLPWVAGDMWVDCIKLVVSGNAIALPTPNDVTRLFRNYVLTFTVNQTEYLQAPLELFPAGGGPQFQGQLSTAQLAMTTTTFGMNNGLPSSSAGFFLNTPIPIGQGESFEVQLNGTTFTTDASGGTTLGGGLFLKIMVGGQIGKAASQ